MRMSCLSAMRQPCSAFSCIAVTRKRPSGEKEMSRCEPFQCNYVRRGGGVREPQRRAIVVRDGDAVAFGHESEAAHR